MEDAETIKRILDIARASSEVAAVLVPRHFAYRLVDSLYPRRAIGRGSGIAGIDMANRLAYDKRENERSRYIKLVDDGGYIGMIYDCPMIVADDVVICPLSREDLPEAAERLGFSIAEVMGVENG